MTINTHNQVALYTVEYTEDQKVMGFSKQIHGIRWKILAILWCNKNKKIANAGEPVFVLWSRHITQWDNCEATQVTQVHVTYPRWKFVPESRIKAIMTTPIVELSEEQSKLKIMALRGFCPDPENPKAAKILKNRRRRAGQNWMNNAKAKSLAPPQANSIESWLLPRRENWPREPRKMSRLHHSPRRTRAKSTTSSGSCVQRSNWSNRKLLESRDSREKKIII